MMDQATESGGGTCGWTCFDHGYFPVLCACGYVQGQDHDVLCKEKKKKKGNAA